MHFHAGDGLDCCGKLDRWRVHECHSAGLLIWRLSVNDVDGEEEREIEGLLVVGCRTAGVGSRSSADYEALAVHASCSR